MERTGTAVFIAMIAFLAFVGGAMTILAQAFPYQYLRNAYRAGESLVVQRQLTDDPLGTSMYQPARDDARGVTVHDPDRAFEGYTLYTSGDEQVARLIDMDGNLLYEWQLPFSKVWNDTAAVKKPQPDHMVYKERARLLPNGDVLVIYNSPGETPWGYGMARIDRNSNPSWSYLEQVHHDLDIAPDGRIYTLTHELSSDVPEAAPQLDAPYLKDFLVVLSEDGRELEKISLTEPFLRSRYKFLFTTLPYYALADPLHTNSVEYISDESPELSLRR
ncbi:hypothetical protein ACFQEX_13700 [Roseibium salinum]|uniref:hypothetical protein n=1 Tax=Roseibium salinum TaxID=1604349 RepID=UPI003609856C